MQRSYLELEPRGRDRERESRQGGSEELGVPEEPSGHSVNWILGVLAQNVKTAAFARREWGVRGGLHSGQLLGQDEVVM